MTPEQNKEAQAREAQAIANFEKMLKQSGWNIGQNVKKDQKI